MNEVRVKMKSLSRKHQGMATAPTRKKAPKTVRPSRENAEKIADILVEAMEKKLAGLPKAEQMKERERAIAFFRAGTARR